MHDLEKMLEKLLEDAQALPEGPIRIEFLKEIGSFRVRINALNKRTKSDLDEIRPYGFHGTR